MGCVGGGRGGAGVALWESMQRLLGEATLVQYAACPPSPRGEGGV